MKKRISAPGMAMIAAAAIYLGCRFVPGNDPEKTGKVVMLGIAPRIYPDYASTVIPPNIAPLNFTINEPGVRFFTRIHGAEGAACIIESAHPQVEIPMKKWKYLLTRNKGGTIHIDIYTKEKAGGWSRYASLVNKVAREEIDGYLVYRLIPPLYTQYGKMGIYERNLSTFEEKPIWLNRMSGNNCMNCHAFKSNDPEYMVMHMRGGAGNGTLIKQGRNLFKLNTETEFNKPGGYPAWHPSGALIAFSVNGIRQFFHAAGDNREGFDKGSKIIIYNIATNTVSSSPPLYDPGQMTTQPEWSPDGKYLFYCSAPQFPSDSIHVYHTRIFYDLRRISYSMEKDTWGKPETVLSHEKTGLSISFPRVSPDGQFLLCCMAPYGTFPVFRPGGDVYLLNLHTGAYRRLGINSNKAESFPQWSSNGRWFVFSSKRINGICARPYLSHLDAKGVASKPLLLPQKDPRYYASLLKTYNLPVLVKGPVSFSPQAMVRVLQNNKRIRKAGLSAELKEYVAGRKSSPSTNNALNEAWKPQGNKETMH